MNGLELVALVSKIAVEAPVLLPDALKLMADLNQCGQDFQKLMTDFQGIKSGAVVVTPPAA